MEAGVVEKKTVGGYVMLGRKDADGREVNVVMMRR